MDLLAYEIKAQLQGYRFIAGVDEVGLGPIAGPVCASAVILDLTKVHELQVTAQLKRKQKVVQVNDSKQLTPRERQLLYPKIIDNCLAYGIGEVDIEEVNRVKNIRQCGFLARFRAVRALSIVPDCILIDGPFQMDNVSAKVVPIIDGDCKSLSIAAASVIAKVYRDSYMTELAKDFPMYDWEHNMGYCSKNHLAGIAKHGLCVHHRSYLMKGG